MFKRKIRELDVLFDALEMNSSNNYKDAAKQNYQDICSFLDSVGDSGKYPAKLIAKYREKADEWAPRMDNYNHQNNVKSF